jgi:hypothetical protein
LLDTDAVWQDEYLPFTFSHPAAILPFSRRRLVFSALVLGSMAPDFLYFMRLSDANHFGHTLPGLFLFCLPMGLAVLWLYHRALKAPLLSVAPDALRERISQDDVEFSFEPASRLGWILLSLLIGAVAHIIWDGFTHRDGMFVHHWQVLRHAVPFWPRHALYQVLQQFSTLIGLGCLARCYLLWLRRTPVQPAPAIAPLPPKARAVIAVLSIALASTFATVFAVDVASHYRREWFSVFVVKFVVAFITAGFLEILAFALYWHITQSKTPEPEFRG